MKSRFQALLWSSMLMFSSATYGQPNEEEVAQHIQTLQQQADQRRSNKILENAFRCAPEIKTSPLLGKRELEFSLGERCQSLKQEDRDLLLLTLTETYCMHANVSGSCDFESNAYPYTTPIRYFTQDEAFFNEKIREEIRRGREVEQAQQEQQQKQQQEQRRADLKAGIAKISSIIDARLFYSSSEGEITAISEIADSPLLEADDKIRYGRMTVDFQEPNGLLRCKTNFSRYGFNYVFLRLSKKTVALGSNPLKIGGDINVVGKYSANVQYTTVAGEGRTAPVIEVLYRE